MLTNRCLLWSAAVALAAASTVVSAATAQRTYVSSSGTANPSCSRAAPCRQFADAIPATNVGGEIVVLDSAGYGPVTITKSVSIIAPPGIYAGISVFSGNGVTINAPGATVVLRGLSINGQGGAAGILVQQAARVRIENCVVSNMGAQGIYHHADNAEVIVLDTISRDNGDAGFDLVAFNASIVLDHVRSEHNANVGFYIAPTSGSSYARAMIAESVFANNGGNGIWADTLGGAITTIQVERSVLAGNAQNGFYANAGASGAAARVTLTRNSFHRNGSYNLYALGILPGQVYAYVSENAFTGGDMQADGSGSYLVASANTGDAQLSCANGANFRSFGNNNTLAPFANACSFGTISGF